jgi:glycerol-3-phosphate dehydrogenase
MAHAQTNAHDIAIIGGGINGAGIARDAAGRGLSVILFEKDDLASATSSASTKLIHGGLRYLEHFAFRLVRESLQERERLLKIAPHIIWPMRFILPQTPGMRPGWMLRLGLFLYDHLGGRDILPATANRDLTRAPFSEALRVGITSGFEYSDLWVEDARLVVLNARDAAQHGADIRTRIGVLSARRDRNSDGPFWQITAQGSDGQASHHAARILINAAGPWAAEVTSEVVGLNLPSRIRMVKGSHIVVRRLFAHDRAFLFQNRDGRIIFAIPYETDFTLIGTTDEDFTGDPRAASISADERDYLLGALSNYLTVPVRREDIIWSYSGVRPLYDDGASKAQEATRDYVLKTDCPAGEAPALNVFGGKLTTYRRLAEHALSDLAEHLPESARQKAGWTMHAPLPGGDFPHDQVDALTADLKAGYPFLSARQALRLIRAYGTEAATILGDARQAADLGQDHGAGLTEREVRWLCEKEWAMTPEDILWRRSKLGLHMSEAERAAFAARF